MQHNKVMQCAYTKNASFIFKHVFRTFGVKLGLKFKSTAVF